MSERTKHLFQFRASIIANAAKAEAEYHQTRLVYWRTELEKATAAVEATACVKVSRLPITGGWRPEVVVNYGDPSAYTRMQEAAAKINIHEKAAERYTSDASLYATQDGRNYELDADDVAHFRLNGRPRDE